ncbi:MAG: hypothetical protein NVS1B11_06500 [Terriglobales bacterium]
MQIALSEPITPQTMVLNAPDRLVIDFPNALAGPELHKTAIGNDQVKSVRVGLFKANPPVTRVVVDLKASQKYELQSSGNSTLVRFEPSTVQGNAVAVPKFKNSLGAVNLVPAKRILAQPTKHFSVQSEQEMLTVRADNATLAEVLFEVHQKTGADIPIPSGAEQEKISVNLGPGPAREVLSSLLNGTHFNFVIVGSEGDPGKLQSVILTSKGGDAPGSLGAPARGVTIVESPEPDGVQLTPEPDPGSPQQQPDGTPPPSDPPPADQPPPPSD